MKLKAFLLINAWIFVPFGIAMLIIPAVLFPWFGINLDDDGLLMARVVGSSLFTLGLISYLMRDESGTSAGLRALLVGSMIFHFIDASTTFVGTVNGTMNTLGWMFSSMHFILALGFLYYLNAHRIKTETIE